MTLTSFILWDIIVEAVDMSKKYKKRKTKCSLCGDTIMGSVHEAMVKIKGRRRVKKLCLGCLMYLRELENKPA